MLPSVMRPYEERCVCVFVFLVETSFLSLSKLKFWCKKPFKAFLILQLDNGKINVREEGEGLETAALANNGRYVKVQLCDWSTRYKKPPSWLSVCDHCFQVLEAIMDIMQVLQNICKSPEAHDKGPEAMSRTSLTCHYWPIKSFVFLSRIPVPVRCPHPPGCGQSFWAIQQHGRGLALQALPSTGRSCPALGWWGRRCPAAVLQRLPLHPAQPFAHGLSGRHPEA